MALLAVLDEGAHGALDESLKTLYVQNTEDKKFYLDIAPDEAGKLAFNLQKQLEAKKGDLTRVHGEKGDLAKKLKAYESLDLTPEQIVELRDSKRPEDIQKLVEAHKAEIETMKKSFEEPIVAAKSKAERLEQQIQQSLAQSAIQKLRNEFDLNDTADYVLRDFIKVVPKEEGSDEYAVKVFENGSPALVAGQEMTPEQLIKSFQDNKKFPAMFNAGTAAGGDATNRQASLNGSTIKVSREASKTNPGLYQQAKAQAEKTGGQVVFTD